MVEETNNKKVLYVIVNIGFAEEVAEIMRKEGARGATIMNARGVGAVPQSILGITIDMEKEIIMSVVDEDVSVRIIHAIRENGGLDSPSHSICFTMPVERFVMTNKPLAPKTQPE